MRMTLNDLPLRYKLIIHFLLISILPSIGLGFLIGWTVERVMDRQVNDTTLQLIGKVNRTLDSYVGNMQNITYLISSNPPFQRYLSGQSGAPGAAVGPGTAAAGEADRYEMSKFLHSITSMYPEVAGILVARSGGGYFSNDMYTVSDGELTEEFWYKEAVQNRGIFKIIGHPSGRNVTSLANYSGDEVVSMVRAILNPETQGVLGVVLIDLKLRVISEAAKDVRLGKSGYLMVVDKFGEAIYMPRHTPLAPFPDLRQPDGGSGGTFSREVGGTELQFLYRTSSFTEWTTVGVFSAEDSASWIREIRVYVVGFVFLVCLLGIAASYYLSHSISRPIQKLLNLMHKAESGDLGVRSMDPRNDEVGALGRGLNHMLIQITKLMSLTERQERQKREAELKSLQAQIKPHFLYNTLDTIHWLSRKHGAEDVAEVVSSLSKLFRISLSRGHEMIPLGDELEHIRSYLHIQQTRYRDKLQYEIDVSPELHQCYVLKILLQPVVENAIYHGIKQRRGPGLIRLEVRVQDSRLVLRVHDNGRGMPPETLNGLRSDLAESMSRLEGQTPANPAAGYGILNVQDRIVLTFGPSYGLQLESTEGVGTTVTITHPVMREPRKELEHDAGEKAAMEGDPRG